MNKCLFLLLDLLQSEFLWLLQHFDGYCSNGFKDAFLNGDFKKEFYMQLPTEYSHSSRHVYRLCRAVCGLKASSRACFSKLLLPLVLLGFIKLLQVCSLHFKVWWCHYHASPLCRWYDRYWRWCVWYSEYKSYLSYYFEMKDHVTLSYFRIYCEHTELTSCSACHDILPVSVCLLCQNTFRFTCCKLKKLLEIVNLLFFSTATVWEIYSFPQGLYKKSGDTRMKIYHVDISRIKRN